MRSVDDKVVYELNTSIPTDSFSGKISAKEKCRELFQKLHEIHQQRRNAIKQCVNINQVRVDELRKLRQKDINDIQILQKLRTGQTTLRLMQSELMVEEVVCQRSMKIFKERCRLHYSPPEEPS